MSVYKKFSPLDYATVPFNAHKQYDFNSASAASNNITYFDTRWTSESISNYSGNSGSDDTINAIKYQQLDHLYYRNFKLDVNNKLGDNHYLNQKRILHKNANILSIPAGLYGYKIKPGSFFLSSSDKEIIDDKKGNLINKNTDLSFFVTDPRTNTLNIGPVKGFKLYDLNVIEGYLNDVYYRDGEVRANPTFDSYSTREFLPHGTYDYDDSYYFNNIEYQKVTFSEYQLADFDRYPGINFNGASSQIIIGHDDKFNYNNGDDFTINFFITNNFTISGSKEYIISKSTTKTIVPSPNEKRGGISKINSTGSSQPIDVSAESQYPFEIYTETSATESVVFFERSDGNITTIVSASFQTASSTPVDLTDLPNNGTDGITLRANNDANLTTTPTNDVLVVFDGSLDNHSGFYSMINNQQSASFEFRMNDTDENNQFYRDISIDIDFETLSNTFSVPSSLIINKVEITFAAPLNSHRKPKIFGSNDGTTFLELGVYQGEDDSTEKTISFSNGTSFKHYRLFFERNLYSSLQPNISVNKLIVKDVIFYTTGGTNENPHHISCRCSSSKMQIFVDGVAKNGTIDDTSDGKLDNSVTQTQNNANIYIGSKGGKTNFYSGSLSQINIFNQALTNDQIFNHYLSSDGSPYVGNIFYSTGIIAITQPGTEESVLSNPSIDEMILGENLFIGSEEEKNAYFGIHQLKFQGSHLIYENEYQCTIDEHEFTDTLNPSARKIRSNQSPDLADFATGSLFRPYITTVGLYNENNELLVVGKLGQPIRTSNETDTTLIVRWDT